MLGYFSKVLYSFIYGVRYLRLSSDPKESTLAVLVTKTSYLMWIAELIMVHVILLRACMPSKGVYKLFTSWQTLRFPCPVPGCVQRFEPTFLRRRNVLIVLAALHFTIQFCSVVFPLLPVAAYSQLNGIVMAGFTLTNVPVKILVFCASLYSSVVFVVPSYFFLLIGKAIVIDFRHLQNDLKRCLNCENGRVKVKTLEWFRLRHNALCMLVETADEIFAPWIFLTLGCAIVQILAGIFSVYATSGTSKELTEMSQIYWILTYFLQMATILYTGASVNSAVSQKVLYNTHNKQLQD